jgi:methyl-accepting chemotaxis protein
MNQGTQQNAAMVEQIAATADLLSHQAQELIQAVSAFKLAGGQSLDSHPRMRGQSRAADTVNAARAGPALRNITPHAGDGPVKIGHAGAAPILGSRPER